MVQMFMGLYCCCQQTWQLTPGGADTVSFRLFLMLPVCTINLAKSYKHHNKIGLWYKPSAALTMTVNDVIGKNSTMQIVRQRMLKKVMDNSPSMISSTTTQAEEEEEGGMSADC